MDVQLYYIDFIISIVLIFEGFIQNIMSNMPLIMSTVEKVHETFDVKF